MEERQVTLGLRSLLPGIAFAVTATAQARPLDYRLDVGPWFARLGCAAAECHGGALGRGGFKLSLFGGDPALDQDAIALDRAGRRIDFVDPAQSLLLRKPTQELDHGGGRRLARDSDAEIALRDWIARGAPRSAAEPPRIVDLGLVAEVDRVRAVARIRWQEGETTRTATEDVTARTLFDSTASEVVHVDSDGMLTRRAPGEAWITARFGGVDARWRTVAAFPAAAVSTPLTTDALGNAWQLGLAELGLVPAEPAAPEVLLRRLFLSVGGRLPTPAERRTFLAAPPEHRLEDAVDRLLVSDDFAAVAADWFAEWFEVPEGATALRTDLRRIAAADRSLLDAFDSRFAAGQPLLDRLPDPRDRAELFARAVLGVRLSCARCHDHPLDRWRRDQHLAFSALFVDPRPAATGGMTDGILFDPATGDPVEPHTLELLGRDPLRGAPRVRLRAALRDDPQHFARNVVNRVMRALCGRGFVEPVDDHRLTNPGVLGAAEDQLVAEFVAADFRLRPLVRRILGAPMWSVDSAEPAIDATRLAAERAHFARREALPLSEPLLRAAAARALMVRVHPAFERAASPLALWLSLWNGDEVAALLEARGSALEAIALLDDDLDRVESLFQLLLCREPTDAEAAPILLLLSRAADPEIRLRSLAHAMLLSREFTSLR